MNTRMDKVNQQLKREIGTIILRDLSDPRLQLVSITRVECSKDLRNAKVFFSVLGDDKRASDAKNGLTSAQGFIRRMIGNVLNLRYTPEFIFAYDQSLANTVRMEETLKEIRNEGPDGLEDTPNI